MRQLIVNGDDFGYAPGVNRGILDAHRSGIVTSTTVMINLPDAPAALELALTGAPDLGLGLHLNLTVGRPVSPPDQVASLLDEDGRFFHIDAWAARFNAIDPDDVQREIIAQFERFVSLTGRTPDHLDAHHHASYLHPAGLETMLALAHEHRDLPMRSGHLDLPTDEVVATLGRMFAGFEGPLAVRLVERLQEVLADGPAPFWPARFEMGFFGKHATLGDLLILLVNLPEDSLTQIMCHPGYIADLPMYSGYRDQREDEIGHLTHAATLECVRAEGITLTNYGELVRPAL